MYRLILLRHGESVWNRENRFTGWVDVPLSDKGEEEALEAGRLLAGHGWCSFDVAYTSVLSRAIKTLWIVLETIDRMWIPVIQSWRLNERHYGALQGLNKRETAEQYGIDLVRAWRRDYTVRPPALDRCDPHFPGNDPRYASLSPDELPRAESLQDTVRRLLPLWQEAISPAIQTGKQVLIVAHGNSLRALVKHLDGISDADVPALTIPTGFPLVYELDGDLRSLRHYYLGDPAAVAEAVQTVADELQLPSGAHFIGLPASSGTP